MGRKATQSGIDNPTIQVSREAKDAFVAWLERAGHPQSWAVSRILSWFVAQEPRLQRVVLNQISQMEPDYARALHEWADTVAGKRSASPLQVPGVKTGTQLEEEHRREAASTPGQKINRRPKS